jgi:FAR-17a/AIG1-like protein
MANETTHTWNRGVFGALVKLLHVIACVQFTYAIYYDYTQVHVPQHLRRTTSNFGGKFKFLTFLNAVRIQTELV